jgi:hypothetical protein
MNEANFLAKLEELIKKNGSSKEQIAFENNKSDTKN